MRFGRGRTYKPRPVYGLDEHGKLITVDPKRNKYSAQKTEGFDKDGNLILFDSRYEAVRNQELVMLERAGEIRNLKRQVSFVLLEGNEEERALTYIADFVYEVVATNAIEVEDVKGFKTKEYVIKRKLMRHVHGIRIKEIR